MCALTRTQTRALSCHIRYLWQSRHCSGVTLLSSHYQCSCKGHRAAFGVYKSEAACRMVRGLWGASLCLLDKRQGFLRAATLCGTDPAPVASAVRGVVPCNNKQLKHIRNTGTYAKEEGGQGWQVISKWRQVEEGGYGKPPGGEGRLWKE